MSFDAGLLRRALLWDGAMGTALVTVPGFTSRMRVEALNLTMPDSVRELHQAYVDSGADILQTNTYQATWLALSPQGLDVRAVNEAALRHARAAADSSPRPIWVAGSIGPLGPLRYAYDILTNQQMEEVYAEQIRALLDGGADLLVAETMGDLREALAAVRAARAVAPDLPLVVQFEVSGPTSLVGPVSLARAVREVERAGVDAVGANCRVGPDVMRRTAEHLVDLTDLPLSIQPNGGVQGVDTTGRMHTYGSPEEFAEMAAWAMKQGVSLVGSCCHTTPHHTKAMRAALDANPVTIRPPYVEPPLSRLARKLDRGDFIICVEIDPPTDSQVQDNPGVLQQKIDGARYLEQRYGMDVVTVADHTMGQPWLDPFPFAEVMRPHLHHADLLLHYSCRNKAETDITGNFASFKLYGYRNILIITGDPPANPEDDSFFKYSAVKLIDRIKREHPDSFLLACALDHTRGLHRGEEGLAAEIRRTRRKVEKGAGLALTQPVFLDRIELLWEHCRELDIPVLPGIMPIFSLRHAETVSQFGGIVIPDYVLERLRAAGDDREARSRAAIEIAGDVAQRAKALGFPGVYLISSFNRFDVIGGTIERMNRQTVPAL